MIIFSSVSVYFYIIGERKKRRAIFFLWLLRRMCVGNRSGVHAAGPHCGGGSIFPNGVCCNAVYRSVLKFDNNCLHPRVTVRLCNSVGVVRRKRSLNDVIRLHYIYQWQRLNVLEQINHSNKVLFIISKKYLQFIIVNSFIKSTIRIF